MCEKYSVGVFFCLFLIVFGTSGCHRRELSDRENPEISDKSFILATKYVRDELFDDAIHCLNDVIRSHKNSPESSLLLGTIYLDKKNDPVTAIYFLKKYADECGNTKQAQIAEQLIDTAKKEFLKSFPAYNGIAQNEAELMEILKSLKNQNAALRQQMVAHRQKISDYETKIDTLQNMLQSANKENLMPHSPYPQSETITIHTVEDGETLSSISNKYYGTSNAWQKIFEANSVTLKNPKNLRIGQQLIIPSIF
ncbi:MAG: LysM peptidoglycan-binding domain-containing protein [Puniceicoccales bacterium]|jgi:LysM repeat protein|nr:LysM peptidoglycan-binding domain-containing protein [Puniceicoccales bacterium]